MKQTILHDEQDYRQLIRLIARFGKKGKASIYHWCLMPNHYHVLVEMPDPLCLTEMVGNWQQVYALKYHGRHNTAGRLFQGRFKCQAVDKESYLLACGRYIEQNPVRAGLCEHAWDWPWSSAGYYVNGIDDPLTSCDPLWKDGAFEQYRVWLEERSAEDEKLFRSSRDIIGSPDLGKYLMRKRGRFVYRRKGRRLK